MKRIIQSILVVSGLLMGSAAFAAEEIAINGSTTVLPVIQKASEAFMQNNPSIGLSISGSGSSNGIKALSEKLCQIAMASRDIKESETASAMKNGVTPYRITIAYDAIIPVVHSANPVKNLTLQQLQGIYAGTITNWKDVGGKAGEIVVVSRDTSSGTYESWGELVMKKERVSPKALLQASNGAVVTTVSKNQRAIGYVGFGYMNAGLKALQVEGRVASPQSVVAKEWPLSRELFLFTDGQPAGSVKQFIDYMLDPKKGQKNVQEVGYVPL